MQYTANITAKNIDASLGAALFGMCGPTGRDESDAPAQGAFAIAG